VSPSGTTLAALAARIGASVARGDTSLVVDGVASLEAAGPSHVTFFANKAYRGALARTHAGAIIVAPDEATLPELAGKSVLVAPSPYAAFAKASAWFHPEVRPAPAIDPHAVVASDAVVDPSAHVGALAVVEAGARVGAGAVLHPLSYVGAGAVIGDGSVLWPHAVVRDGCIVGARCVLHSGAVVGADGFGFAFDPDGDGAGPMHRNVPQAGIARLEDDVELGANSCVDRATLGETVVGRGTKVDNLVQIAHNVQVGALTVIAAQAGIAGSAKVGMGVQVGGQAGVVGHIAVGDLAKLGARTAVMRDVEPGATMMGTPAVEANAWKRSTVAVQKLPDVMKELRELKARVAALESGTTEKKRDDR
jgi:UDP-3-O-[3-hydroxymyristoyl] glucosamine N-acyltransferase